MRWLNAKSIEELKQYGSIKLLRQDITEFMGEKHTIKGRSYEEIFKRIVEFKEVSTKLVRLTRNDYFVSDSDKYIFYLVELDGEDRFNKLQLTDTQFRERKAAKKWRDNIAKVIHPDCCHHPKANEAMNELTMLYDMMKGER